MNLQAKLAARVAAGKPVRVGLVGAGKFGSMFLSQVPSIPGLEVAVISETSIERGQAACRNVGWDEARITRTKFSDRGRDACLDESVEVVVEATGRPDAGIAHAIRSIDAGKHIVMVNVEADCLAGWLLAAKAREGRRLFDGLWRPTRARRRDGGLGALRPDAGGGKGGGHERADVQFVS
jgi:predicted homoserine dehydrogenase-like protein